MYPYDVKALIEFFANIFKATAFAETVLAVKLEALVIPGGDMGQQMVYPSLSGCSDKPI